MKKHGKAKTRRVAQVSELKAGLSGYLAQVKRGEEIIVTERGRTIAKIIPVPLPENDEEARMREAERQGRIIVRGSGRLPDSFFAWERPKVPEGAIERWIAWERYEDES
ncbi:MAG: type II toxin-antitoxin system prevent-host-death family antitoxin [Candidatus Eisenbacteria bacterium]|mgnify:FL=1